MSSSPPGPTFLLGSVLDIFDVSREEQVALAMHRRELMHEIRDLLKRHPEYFDQEKFASLALTVIWSDFLQLDPERSRITRKGELPLRLYVPVASLRDIIDADEYRGCMRWLCFHALQAAKRTNQGDLTWIQDELAVLPNPRFA